MIWLGIFLCAFALRFAIVNRLRGTLAASVKGVAIYEAKSRWWSRSSSVESELDWFLPHGESGWRIPTLFRGVDFLSDAHFRIVRESESHTALKRWNVLREQQVGIAEFDRNYFLISDNAALGSFLKRSEPARALIARLFRAHVLEIRADGRYLWVGMDDDFHPAKVDELLVAFAEELKQLARRTAGAKRDPSEWLSRAVPALWWASVTVALGMAGVAAFDARTTVDSSVVGIPTLVLGIVAGQGATAAYIWRMRNSSHGGERLLETGLLGLIGGPLVCFMFGYHLNMSADFSEPQIHTHEVDRGWCTERSSSRLKRRGFGGFRGRNRTPSCYVELISPDPAREIVNPVRIPYSMRQQETQLRFVYSHHRGRFGSRWYEQLRIDSVGSSESR